MTSGDHDLTSAFRMKVIAMKSWKPASAPSNRDRLELYALHKQAVSGDAPGSFSTTASAAERAKYQAWRSKLGVESAKAMRLYLQEADRQIGVYGIGTPVSASMQATPTTSHVTQAPPTSESTPRGLAAITLLCAAASESRPAYIRRLAQTPIDNAWWKRQEPLCGIPGTMTALPEWTLLTFAQFVEHFSLASQNNIVRSFMWPLHNSLLSLWMLCILVLTMVEFCATMGQILLWGSRRTGLSLDRVWGHDFPLLVQCIQAMCEPFQATTCRLVGLVLLPVSYGFQLETQVIKSNTLASSLCIAAIVSTWWYFLLVLPWLSTCLIGTSLASGVCFALIEAAGV
eukprot:Nitzschia sp. Nitz4//scaffold47_size129522//55386//56478//NITZ4_003550-RA/size129522-snap-gene-0.197-mRNA-1//-1//CDS//3329552797//2703//frame0